MPYALLQKELTELPVETLREAFRRLPDLVDADRTALDGACAPSHLVLDILCGKHRTLLLGPLRALESLRQIPLAWLQDSVIFSLQLKCPFMRKVKVCKKRIVPCAKGDFESLWALLTPKTRLGWA